MKWPHLWRKPREVVTYEVAPPQERAHQPGDLWVDETGATWEAFEGISGGEPALGWQLVSHPAPFHLWAVVLYSDADPDGGTTGSIERVIFHVTEKQAWDWIGEHKPPYYDVIKAEDR